MLYANSIAKQQWQIGKFVMVDTARSIPYESKSVEKITSMHNVYSWATELNVQLAHEQPTGRFRVLRAEWARVPDAI